MFQSINAIYIVLLGPVFAWLWLTLGRRGLRTFHAGQVRLAVIQVGAGFLILVAGAKTAGADNLTPVLFIFLIYLIHTTGELCLSPVGLSAMNRLTPPHMASLIMGTWFFASATGNFTAGLISAATGGEGAGPERVLGDLQQCRMARGRRGRGDAGHRTTDPTPDASGYAARRWTGCTRVSRNIHVSPSGWANSACVRDARPTSGSRTAG